MYFIFALIVQASLYLCMTHGASVGPFLLILRSESGTHRPATSSYRWPGTVSVCDSIEFRFQDEQPIDVDGMFQTSVRM